MTRRMSLAALFLATAMAPAVADPLCDRTGYSMGGGKPWSSIRVGKEDGRLRRILLEGGSYQTIAYGTFPPPRP